MLIQGWKLRAQEFPDRLAEKIIQKHLATFSMGELFILAQRDNPTAFYAQLSFLQQEAFLVLLALNRRYFPTFKWMYPVLESMGIKPEAVDLRFRRTYQAPYMEAIADMGSILLETVHLVERWFSQLDMASIYRHLNYRRAPHAAGEPAHFSTECKDEIS